MSFHIGKLINEQLKKIGMTKSEFARRIASSPQHIHYVLQRNSIDTDLLQKVSRTLDYDFFQHYLGLKSTAKGNHELIGISSNEIRQELIAVKAEIETIKRQNEYIREIVELIKPSPDSAKKSSLHLFKKYDLKGLIKADQKAKRTIQNKKSTSRKTRQK
jgi:plasmid maintenance system antidote protein VapI